MSIATIVVFLGGLYIVVQGVLSFLFKRDAAVSNKRVTLLDTVIDAKANDIVKDEQTVKEDSDAYEAIKRNRNRDDR